MTDSQKGKVDALFDMISEKVNKSGSRTIFLQDLNKESIPDANELADLILRLRDAGFSVLPNFLLKALEVKLLGDEKAEEIVRKAFEMASPKN